MTQERRGKDSQRSEESSKFEEQAWKAPGLRIDTRREASTAMGSKKMQVGLGVFQLGRAVFPATISAGMPRLAI